MCKTLSAELEENGKIDRFSEICVLSDQDACCHRDFMMSAMMSAVFENVFPFVFIEKS